MVFTIAAKTRPFTWGDRQAVVLDISVTDYQTGGEVLTAAVAGLPSADHPYIVNAIGIDGLYIFQHVESTDKLKIATAAGEIALHATASIRVTCVGPRVD